MNDPTLRHVWILAATTFFATGHTVAGAVSLVMVAIMMCTK